MQILTALESLSRYLYIESCRICNTFVDPESSTVTICKSCASNIEQDWSFDEFQVVENERLAISSATTYDATLKKLIYKLKYDRDQLIAKDLAFLMKACLEELIASIDSPNIVLVPIPLSQWRKMHRGFNQAELIANELAAMYKLPIRQLLKRTKHTKAQHNLGKIDRMENLRKAFTTNLARPAQKIDEDHLILIDDICTSGSTLIEAATTLYADGFQNIQALTVSRAQLEMHNC